MKCSRARTVTGSDVITDPLASPTGYPFKVVTWKGRRMPRRSVIGSVISAISGPRSAIREQSINYRCPSEPIDTFLKKGGTLEETVGRQCLCNALLANIGLAQSHKDGTVEPPLLTSGDDLKKSPPSSRAARPTSAGDVLDYLLGEPAAS